MIRSILLTSLLLAIAASPLHEAVAADVPLDDLLNHISQQERKLSNLKVVSEFKEQHLSTGAPRVTQSATAWLIAVPGNNFRIDVVEQKAQGKQYSRTDSWNGHARYDFLHESNDRPRGVLKGERSTFRDSLLCGWKASLYGCCDPQTFSGYIQEQRKTPGRVSAAEEQDGSRHVTLTITDVRGCTWLVFTFDPTRGYALVREILYDQRPEHRELCRLEVTEMKEVLEGVYYPTRATIKWPSVDSLGEYHATSVIANDPKFDEGAFTFRWPLGTVVHDQATGIVTVIGQEPGGAK